MRILHLDSGMTWRGGQQQLYFLVKGLKNKDLKQHLVLKKEGFLARRLKDLDLPVTELKLSSEFDFISTFSLAMVIRQFRPHLIHTHDSRTLSSAVFLRSMGFKFRIVASRRVAYSIRHNPLWKFKYSFGADRIIAVSYYIRNLLIKDGLLPNQIEVVYDGANTVPPKRQYDRSMIRKQLGVKKNEFVIGCVGAFTSEKGHELLIRAFSLISNRKRQFRLVLVGDGPLLIQCQQLLRKLNLENSVTLTGFIVDLDEVFPAFDLLIQPSLSEGLGSVVLSGMAHQIPVCASRIGGLPEIVIDGETGFLFSPEVPQNLARAILDVSELPRLAQHQAEQAYLRLSKKFSVDHMVLKTLKVYSDVLRTRSS